MIKQYRNICSLVATVWPLIGLAALLTGCATVGPDYVPPEVETSETWSTELEDGLKGVAVDPQDLAIWWHTLEDPLLTGLIERAVAGSLDVKTAMARLRESRARRGFSNADRFPTLDFSGSVTKSRSSGETGPGVETDLYSTGFDASWELDLFGGKRRSVEAADADLEASRENLYDVLVSLTSEAALNYIEVRAYQTRLTISEANRDAQEKTYELVRNRFEAGLTALLDVEQARYNLESTRSDIPSLHTGLAQAKNRLAVLLGLSPGSLEAELQERRAIPVTPVEVAVGVPADLLRRRPDIRKAERELASQTAQIGVATAELYPKLTLVGSIGLESLASGSLLQAASKTYSLIPGISWNIFDAGRIRQNIAVETALQERALISYEAAVLNALEEVENALVAYADEQLRRDSLLVAARAADRAVEMAGDQYKAGLSDFQDVLEAERSLLSFQDQLAASDAEVTSNLIRLYKALGGGWTPLAADPKQQNDSQREKTQ